MMTSKSCAFGTVLLPVKLVDVPEEERGRLPTVPVGDAVLGVNPATQRAMELAARLARGGTVVLLSVIPDLGRATSFLRAGDAMALEQKARDSMEAALEALGAQLLPDVTRRVVVAIDKEPLDAILDYVHHDGVEAIILATSGRTRVQRAFLGSVADKVIRQAPCPVVVMPAHAC